MHFSATQVSDEVNDEIKQHRKATHPIDPLILNRWSPRAMTGEEIADADLMSLFEAARWAPSSYNNQPWRFLYAKRNTQHWQKFFDLMVEFNQGWAKNASVLVVVVSKKTFDHNSNPSHTHSFDAGAAWENCALEGSRRGLVVHGMEGFDYNKARTVLNVPDDYSVEAMIAIGKRAPKESLPEQMQEREVPSQRKPLNEIIMEGMFRN